VVFVFAISLFFVYNRLVEKRQSLVLTKAVQSTAIVSSLFPKQVQDRLMIQQQDQHALSSSLSVQNAPIADLFPNCTVMFADLCGFTAWSR
jgi:hypothetical protein